ncbi:MAG: hypothetical protein AAGI17_08810 [Planctomycetota bacterium]
MQKTSLVLAAACGLTSVAQGQLVVDQIGATLVAGGLGGPVVQTFTPALDNIAAIEIGINGTGALTTDVTVSVFSMYDGSGSVGGLSGLLGTVTVTDVDRGTRPLLTFDSPFLVTPEVQLFMLVELSDALVVSADRDSPSPYDRGSVVIGGGNLSGTDIVFRTFADPNIPAPAAAAVFGAGGLLAARRRRA